MTNVEALKALYVTLGGNAADVANLDSNSEMIEALRNVATGGGGGGESPFFVVTFSLDENWNYICDRTFAEVTDAIQNGNKVVVGAYENILLSGITIKRASDLPDSSITDVSFTGSPCATVESISDQTTTMYITTMLLHSNNTINEHHHSFTAQYAS